LTAAAIEQLQARYWREDAESLDALLGLPHEELGWRDALRLHHLLCIRRAQLPGEGPHPVHAKIIEHLCAANSPFRPRHAFVWEGEGPPEGEDIPYSTHQGPLCNAALSHLGSIEVVRFDAEMRPEALDFVAFDELMTLAASPVAEAQGLRAARLLMEYGRPETTVLVVDHYARLEGLGREPYLLEPAFATVCVPPPIAPTQLLGSGPQRLRRLSVFAAEGITEFELRNSYQISLAIEAEDPGFDRKCRGRNLDTSQMRRDLQRERGQRRKTPSGKNRRLRTL
jgi:hypothetical protein